MSPESSGTHGFGLRLATALAALLFAFASMRPASAQQRLDVSRRADGALDIAVVDARAVDLANEIARVAAVELRGVERLGDVHVTLQFERVEPRDALALVATSASTELRRVRPDAFQFGTLADLPEARAAMERVDMARRSRNVEAIADALDALIGRLEALPQLHGYLPDVLSERSMLAEQGGDADRAVALIERELALRDAAADATNVVESAWRLVTLHRLAQRFDRADAAFARILAAEESDASASAEQRVFTLKLATENLIVQGRLADASELATQAIVLAQGARDPGAALVPALAQRAAIAVVLGNASAALADWTRVVQVREQVLGADATSVSAAYRELAFLARLSGDFDGAQSFDANVQLAIDEAQAWALRPHEGIDASLWPALDAALDGAMRAIDAGEPTAPARMAELETLKRSLDEATGTAKEHGEREALADGQAPAAS